MGRTLPRHPVYIPSRGRYEGCVTARLLMKHEVPFFLVVEPQEEEAYFKHLGHDNVLVLPWSNLGKGGLIAVRNWIKGHATEAGHARHWQLDDNMRMFHRMFRGKRVPIQPGVALRIVEDFTDRYENIAISGMSYTCFVVPGNPLPPFYLNTKIYSCSLILNSLPNKWRQEFNDDTDICLQVLADGWCTVGFNALMTEKGTTMTRKGGNTTIYQGDGRLEMARSLERVWPGVVSTKRRYKRPQHVVRNSWRKFDTKLIRRTDIDWDAIEAHDYGLKLKQVKPVIKSPEVRELLE